jgi:uncharacterized protein YdeI (YjbR/CyaY-like superfamily)
MQTDIEAYFLDGCGRCALYATPQCRVRVWQSELALLRALVLECGLTEELKWGVACYTHRGNNILIVAAFKDFYSLNFFKGSLMRDELGLLTKPGEESQASRLIKFTNVADIAAQRDILKAYVFEAIEVEESGAKVIFKDVSEYHIPEELTRKIDDFPALRAAFEALTPGRQKGYLLHIGAAKQSKTRETRIEKCIPRILEGKGMHD